MEQDLKLFESLMNLGTDLTTSIKHFELPFGYPGSKQNMLQYILPHIPYSKCYVEPFGGTGAVLFNREQSSLEVWNDLNKGLFAFFSCLKDPQKQKELRDILDLTILSREDFKVSKLSWQSESNLVTRAFHWYYSHRFSFGGQGNQWNRSLQPIGGIKALKLRNGLNVFDLMTQRLKDVQILNLSWEQIFEQYDNCETTFYIDPPYLGEGIAFYPDILSKEGHRQLLDATFSLQGFAAVSGYHSYLYDSYPWDAQYTWSTNSSMKRMKIGTLDPMVQEVLWIKKARGKE